MTCGVLWSRSVPQPSRWSGTCPAWWLTGKTLALDLEAARGQVVESEFAQQNAQPPLAGDPGRGGRVVTGYPLLEVLPDLEQVEPGPGGLAPHRLAALQAVGLRAGSRYLRVAGEYPAEQVGGEQAADDLQRAELGHDAPPPGR